jgi:hypothetical protein
MRRSALALALGAWLGCASGGPDAAPAPTCGLLETLAPLAQECEPGELAAFSAALAEPLGSAAGGALVRVELDDAAAVRSVCVEKATGYASGAARRVGERLVALRSVPPGPDCVAGGRIDLNRYEAAEAKMRAQQTRCHEQTRVTRETHGPTPMRDRTAPGAYGVYEREFERCMEYEADWIALDQPGSTRPALWAKPEVANPPGPDASETTSRCWRLSRVFEKRAACIEADGWERLTPAR